MSLLRSSAVITLSAVLAATAVLPAAAQTPGRLSDLVGARAGQSEGELTRRGYQVTDRSEVVGDGRLTYWRRGDECVAILTRDGRYASINQAGRSECGGGGGSGHDNDAGAAIAAVAIIGLAAALGSHNRRHGDDDRHPDHDNEYQRGYQAGLYGSPYDDRHETEGYHDGYLAGEAEAVNRRNANSRWVRQAPQSAQNACSRRADDFQNSPRGSSVPISVRDLGRDQWEMTMGTGSYRSVCRVTSDGRVLSIDPY